MISCDFSIWDLIYWDLIQVGLILIIYSNRICWDLLGLVVFVSWDWLGFTCGFDGLHMNVHMNMVES